MYPYSNNKPQPNNAEAIREARTIVAAKEGLDNTPSPLKVRTWENALFSLSDEIKEPFPTLLRGDDEFIHLGDIQMLEGQPGSKKTFLVSAMCAAAIGGNPDNCLGFEYQAEANQNNESSCRVLYIDTEQNKANTRRVVRRVHTMAGIDPDTDSEMFKVLNMRSDNQEERLRFALDAIKALRPKICFIDNLKDLSSDFNDHVESYKLVSLMMKMSEEYNCAIVCVIHLNKGTTQAKGHLGSALYEKVSLCMTLQVDDPGGESTTRVSMAKKARNKPPQEFAFIIDDYVMPRLTTPPIRNKKRDELAEKLATVMERGRIYPAGEVRKLLANLYGQTSKSTAISHKLKDAVDNHVLIRYGTYRDSSYMLHKVDEPIEEDKDQIMPFCRYK